MADTEQPDVTALTVQLLSAYLANNTVAHTDIADLVRTTKAALVEDKSSDQKEPETPTHTPAVSVRKSLASSEHILSLIDGKPYKTLKRHLTSHGLTPETYRERYNLPANYPLVASGFAEQRRAIAEKIGLGRRPAAPAPAVAADAPAKSAAPQAKAPAKKAAPAAKAKTAAAPLKQTAQPAVTEAKKAPAAAKAKPQPAADEGKSAPRGSKGTLKLFKAKDAPASAPAKATKPKPAAKAAKPKDTAPTAAAPEPVASKD